MTLLFVLKTAILFWGLSVLQSTNAVYSVLSLVLVFALTALLFLLLGAEFFALLLFTVYIGAIAILFLFVIMMLDLRLAELHASAYYHVPLGGFVGFAFLLAVFTFLAPEIRAVVWADFSVDQWPETAPSNLKMLGQVVYNYYLPYVLLVTMILLLAMVAVIALTVVAREPRTALDSDRWCEGNFVWSSFHHCHKGVTLHPWWEPLHPTLAAAKRRAVGEYRKWPQITYGKPPHQL